MARFDARQSSLGRPELFPKGYKNDADRTVCHPAANSWKTDKVYAGETPADQESS